MLHKYVSCLIVLLFFVTACGNTDSQIESLIRDRLLDSNSAQFKTIVKSASGSRACAIWNAKNTMGGYIEWQYTKFSKSGGNWVISKVKEDSEFCTKEYLYWQDEYDKYSNLLMGLKDSDEGTKELQLRIKRLETVDALPEDLLVKIVGSLKVYISTLEYVQFNADDYHELLINTDALATTCVESMKKIPCQEAATSLEMLTVYSKAYKSELSQHVKSHPSDAMYSERIIRNLSDHF